MLDLNDGDQVSIEIESGSIATSDSDEIAFNGFLYDPATPDTAMPTRYHLFVYIIGIQAFQIHIPYMYTDACFPIHYMYTNIFKRTVP